jgi:CPA2 family monovalent cation:H+ antiporter-2
MHDFSILWELVLLSAATLIVIPLFKKIHIPPLVGFLISGMLIGPYGIKLIQNIEAVNILAEVGIVLLLFTIGLEFSLRALKKIKTIVLLGGGLQVLVTVALVFAIGLFSGIAPAQALFLGFLVSLSSTAIVMKLLSEKDGTDTPHGKISIGILLFQDLCIIPMMLLIPMLSASESITWSEFLSKILLSLIAVGVIIAAALYLIPKLIEYLVKIKSRELFILGIVFSCLGTAMITSYFGLSLALGAFIAGLVLSESEYSYEIVGAALPFRDALSSLFFISIGMLLNIGFVLQSSLLVVGLTAVIIALKFFIIFLLVLNLSFPVRTSVIVGLSLAQIGEFSFLLAVPGMSSSLIDETTYQLFLGSSILTMLASPLLIEFSAKIADKAQSVIPERFASKFRIKLIAREIPVEPKVSGLRNHVVIAGYGLCGKNLVAVLKETGIQHVIVDLNGDTVREARQGGMNIIYGDVTRDDILTALRIEQARVFVIALSDPASTRRCLYGARMMNPEVHIIVRTRYTSEIEDLYKLGADQVVSEDFETSIEIFTRVLRQYHLPRNIITTQVDLIRREGYGMLRGLKLPDATVDQIASILAAGTTDTFLVLQDSPACGKTLKELNLRFLSGSTIIAIVRDNISTTNPPHDFRIEAGDILVLIGTHAEIDKAFELLSPSRKVEDL